MERPSLQEIEDRYVAQGLRGNKLKLALEKDRQYKKLLELRKARLKKQFKVKKKDKEQCVLSVDPDFEILEKVYSLEKKNLSVGDFQVVKLIKSQLRHDWRTPLIKELNKLLKKYS